ncbi:MAG: DUF4271 domain-containing protein [Bacteroidales bacterium]|nr:DUF4271 domain-containing protein [Bacteroidales bacterium]
MEPKNFIQLQDSLHSGNVSDTISIAIADSSSSPVQIADTSKTLSIIQDSIPAKKSVIKKDTAFFVQQKALKSDIVIDVDTISSAVKKEIAIKGDNLLETNFLQVFLSKDNIQYKIPDKIYLEKQVNRQQNIIDLNTNNPKVKSADWPLGLIILCILIIIWIGKISKGFIRSIMNSIASYQFTFRLFKEKNIIQKQLSAILNVIYVITISVFFYLLLEYYQLKIFDFSGLSAYLIIFLAVAFFLLARYTVLKITGFLFNKIELFNEYLHTIFLLNKNIGIFLLPVIIALIYVPFSLKNYVIIIGIILIFFGIILRIFRGFQIILKKDVLIFYLILYLCTLEILPLLLGYKFLNSLI